MSTTANCAYSKAPEVATVDPQRCQFSFADGRRCRMQVQPALCPSHARAEAESFPSAPDDADGLEPADIEELTPPYGDFRTATEVNRALGKVFTLLVQGRIPRRNAVALGYIAQLMLQALPRVREEIIAGRGYSGWQETLDSAFRQDEDEPDAPGAEGEAGDEAARQAPLGAPISRLASGDPQTHDTAPIQTEAEAQGGIAVARVFSEGAPAPSEGPEAFASRVSAREAATTSESRRSGVVSPEAASEPEEHPRNEQCATEEVEGSSQPDQIANPIPAGWCRYWDARGNPTLVRNVQLPPLRY